MVNYIELSELQSQIKARIGTIEQWVRVEIESHRVVGGHHYMDVLEKNEDGEIKAKAAARIWRFNSGIVTDFRLATGKNLEPGMAVVVKAKVEYHPQYGLSLVITDIDSSFTVGQQELEKKETIRKLTEAGLMEAQKELEMPFLPSDIAVISSQDAAGFGDFVKHLECNQYGFKYNYTLFQAYMQGENCPPSIIECLEDIKAVEGFNLVLILRGGGAESDLSCYDNYELCKAIAEYPLPVLTAIGHERDYHIADMVAFSHFKTPTALADNLIEWTLGVESEVTDALSNIKFALTSIINLRETQIALLEAKIKAADPRGILQQGYALAVGKDGKILKNARSKSKGEEISVRFSDGQWDCTINEVKTN